MKTNPLLKKIVTLAEEKKAEELIALNVTKITSLSDYFVICSAKNIIQVKAIADNIKDNIHNLHTFFIFFSYKYISNLSKFDFII